MFEMTLDGFFNITLPASFKMVETKDSAEDLMDVDDNKYESKKKKKRKLKQIEGKKVTNFRQKTVFKMKEGKTWK
eukprot:7267135-Ditylum_brightwellii.AAC.1